MSKTSIDNATAKRDAGSSAASSSGSSSAEAQGGQDKPNLLTLFGEGVLNSFDEPIAGAAQVMGNESQASELALKSSTQGLSTAETVAKDLGGMVTQAAMFMGASRLLCMIPDIGCFAPIVAGAALGFLQPSAKGSSLLTHFLNAGIGAGTMSLVDAGPKLLGDLPIQPGLAWNLGKVAITGLGAGFANAEASSLVNNGEPASLGTALTSGLAWAATGAAFGAGSALLSDSCISCYGTPKPGEVYVVDDRFSPSGFAIRDSLQKNHINFKFFDTQSDPIARRAFNSAPPDQRDTMLALPDGSQIRAKGPEDLASKLGLPTSPKQDAYDFVVVGAGPAGLGASIYGSSEGLKTLLVDARGPGGQAGTTSRVENYMGFQDGTSGPTLMGNAFAQTRRLGTDFVINRVKGLSANEDGSYTVNLQSGASVKARSIMLSTGVQFKEMNAPGMAQFKDRGVYYGASMTEADLISKGETIVDVGGANSAGQAAVKHSELVGKNGSVVLLTRSPLEKSMSQYLIDQINARSVANGGNIKVITGAAVDSVAGGNHLETVNYNDPAGTHSLNAKSMFVFIGQGPKTSDLPAQIGVDANGYIVTGPQAKTPAWTLERDPLPNETSMPGVFAAGDARAGSTHRIAVAAGQGADSIAQVHQFLATPEAALPFPQRAPLASARALNPAADAGRIWSEPQINQQKYLGYGFLWGQTRTSSPSVLGLVTAKSQAQITWPMPLLNPSTTNSLP